MLHYLSRLCLISCSLAKTWCDVLCWPDYLLHCLLTPRPLKRLCSYLSEYQLTHGSFQAQAQWLIRVQTWVSTSAMSAGRVSPYHLLGLPSTASRDQVRVWRNLCVSGTWNQIESRGSCPLGTNWIADAYTNCMMGRHWCILTYIHTTIHHNLAWFVAWCCT